MKTFKYIQFLAISLLLVFAACDSDDDSNTRPEISTLELGLDDSRTGYTGSDLHVEAEVIAINKIDYITIEIHQEAEGEDKKAAFIISDESEAWVFDSVYTEFNGLKNTTFHKHIDIPTYIETGDYHFHFIVTDLEGNQTTLEEDLTIAYPEDSIAPEITISSAPESAQTFTSGQTITISGTITDEQALGGIYIGLVSQDQLLDDSEVDDENTITMLHNHDFDDPTEYAFEANITIGAESDNNITPKAISWTSGNYYILVKCKDAYAGNWTYSAHYPIIINIE